MDSRFLKIISNRYSILVPIILLAAALASLGIFNMITGEPLRLGIEFKGGTLLTIDTDSPKDDVLAMYNSFPLQDIRVSGSGYILQFGPMGDEDSKRLAQITHDAFTRVQIIHTGEVISKSLQFQTIQAVMVAFLGMGIVIFVIFRSIVPSLAILYSAFSDIALAMALMNLFHVELSLGAVAALLMLIGYSVDSNILLTSKLVKKDVYRRKLNIDERLLSAKRTGLAMSSTTIGAMIVLFLVSIMGFFLSSFSQISLLRDISMVLLFGLCADLMNTWLFNASLLRRYLLAVEKPKKRRKRRGRK